LTKSWPENGWFITPAGFLFLTACGDGRELRAAPHRRKYSRVRSPAASPGAPRPRTPRISSPSRSIWAGSKSASANCWTSRRWWIDEAPSTVRRGKIKAEPAARCSALQLRSKFLPRPSLDTTARRLHFLVIIFLLRKLNEHITQSLWHAANL
jgi:hypothetical protein